MKCWCGGLAQRWADNKVACLESKFHDPLSDGRPKQINILYIAGPMSGYPECNYPLFNQVAQHLRDVGYTVVNPAEYGNGGRHYVDFLREDLRLMLDCHAVAVLDSWWESTGARNEVQVAGVLKMPVRPWAEWLERAHSELNNLKETTTWPHQAESCSTWRG